MATVRKLPSGKWNVQVRKQGHSPISQSFTTKSDANKWARQTETSIERGVFSDYPKVVLLLTLGQALKRYLAEVTPSKKGAAQEARRINTWLKHPLSKVSLGVLKPSDFVTYRDARIQLASNSTVRLELAIISHLFNVAIKEWSIEGITNPLNGIRKPKVLIGVQYFPD